MRVMPGVEHPKPMATRRRGGVKGRRIPKLQIGFAPDNVSHPPELGPSQADANCASQRAANYGTTIWLYGTWASSRYFLTLPFWPLTFTHPSTHCLCTYHFQFYPQGRKFSLKISPGPSWSLSSCLSLKAWVGFTSSVSWWTSVGPTVGSVSSNSLPQQKQRQSLSPSADLKFVIVRLSRHPFSSPIHEDSNGESNFVSRGSGISILGHRIIVRRSLDNRTLRMTGLLGGLSEAEIGAELIGTTHGVTRVHLGGYDPNGARTLTVIYESHE